ncbi:hypothetical protein INR49_004140 [Caranx melampygus]|nr:hypothetical protein INR49_004140 [Caranx melampygus]
MSLELKNGRQWQYCTYKPVYRARMAAKSKKKKRKEEEVESGRRNPCVAATKLPALAPGRLPHCAG